MPRFRFTISKKINYNANIPIIKYIGKPVSFNEYDKEGSYIKPYGFVVIVKRTFLTDVFSCK